MILPERFSTTSVIEQANETGGRMSHESAPSRKPQTWQERHSAVCRYERDERYGLDTDGCCRCRYLADACGPRPSASDRGGAS